MHGNILLDERSDGELATSLKAEGVVRVMAWNTQGLEASGTSDRARQKFAWLEYTMHERRPAVLVLSEVMGGLEALRGMRKWASKLRYKVTWLVGADGNALSPRNGVVIMFCDVQMRQEGTALRLEERTLGVVVTAKGLDRQIALVGIHGDVASAPKRKRQCDAAARFCSQHGGGVVIGDLNATPCVTWRSDRAAETERSRRQMRNFTGWRCPCCSPEDSATAGGVVGGSGSSGEGAIGWTRFCGPSPTSRIDYAVARGAEVGGWRLVEEWEAEGVGQGDEARPGERLSDHLAVLIECCGARAELGPARAQAYGGGAWWVSLGESGRSALGGGRGCGGDSDERCGARC